MSTEMGSIEITPLPDLPKTQPQAERSGEPPRGKTTVGYDSSGDGGDIPPWLRKAFRGDNQPERGDNQSERRADQTDAALFWAFYGRSLEGLPGIEEVMLKYDLPDLNGDTPPVDPKKLKAFLQEAKRINLIRKGKFSLGEYIDALLPWNQ